jgi:hypothetical protein
MEAPPEKKARVYYGSLEEQERARLESGDVTGSTLSVAVQEGIQAGNINITPVAGGEVRTVADSRQLQLLEEFEKRKRVSGGAGEGRCLAVTSGVPTAGQSHCCAHR